nr:uncharacterized protein LOC129159939 [Nothobranchius furzeri]
MLRQTSVVVAGLVFGTLVTKAVRKTVGYLTKQTKNSEFNQDLAIFDQPGSQEETNCERSEVLKTAEDQHNETELHQNTDEEMIHSYMNLESTQGLSETVSSEVSSCGYSTDSETDLDKSGQMFVNSVRNSTENEFEEGSDAVESDDEMGFTLEKDSFSSFSNDSDLESWMPSLEDFRKNEPKMWLSSEEDEEFWFGSQDNLSELSIFDGESGLEESSPYCEEEKEFWFGSQDNLSELSISDGDSELEESSPYCEEEKEFWFGSQDNLSKLSISDSDSELEESSPYCEEEKAFWFDYQDNLSELSIFDSDSELEASRKKSGKSEDEICVSEENVLFDSEYKDLLVFSDENDTKNMLTTMVNVEKTKPGIARVWEISWWKTMLKSLPLVNRLTF